MFRDVFRYPKYTRYLEAGPFAPFLDEFANLLFERGHCRKAVRQRFTVVGQLGKWVVRHQIDLQDLTNDHIVRFLRTEKCRVYSVRDRGDLATLRLLLGLLRRRGAIPMPQQQKTAADTILDEFEDFLRSEKGMSVAAVESYKRSAQRLIEHRFGSGRIAWRKLSLSDLQGLVLARSKQCQAGTLSLMVTGLRAFLRFLQMRGLICKDLAALVPKAPHWISTGLPYSLSATEVAALLASCDRSTTVGSRDYAVILLLARLGLRSCEVTSLSLDDIHWASGEIVLEGKGQRRKRLPIPCDCGKALAQYIERARPPAKTRRVFVQSFPPHIGFSRSVVGSIVRSGLRRAGITAYRSGSHLLRHTAATQMLAKGASLPEIGMVLGHQRVKTSFIYAKVDSAELRTIAQPWPTLATRGDR